MAIFALGIYLVILTTFVLVSIFIAYHIIKYSINPAAKILMLALFLTVSGLSLIANFTLFFSIDWSFLGEYFQFF